MKTLEEATAKLFPDQEKKTIEDFVLLTGRDIMIDLRTNRELRNVITGLCATAFQHMTNSCGCDPLQVVLELAKESVAIGIAIGMEMEKNENFPAV